ncbi:MRC1-like domain-containing protein [Aspergillus alliaceus]|uniref:MRC1-like domain-containing protein n=1 Tax=Petromyces alliaceus TaxID=209559 RepID=A0A5N7C855_PETAA|nr:MRC1-like domain-containing protein [Aspergillus alliaceus]
MSTPSTPRTARSASPAANSPTMLTPGQKIKAILAEFDSESDSDNGNIKPQRSIARITERLKNSGVSDPQPTVDLDEETSDEDDDIIMPKGRMVARLQAQDSEKKESTFERVSRSLKDAQKHANDSGADEPMSDGDDDEDDLPVAGPRRKTANVKVVAEREEEDGSCSPARARAFSPLFVSSPAHENDQGRNVEAEEQQNEDEPRPKANSRFLALVAQKRKEREEKERTEKEKKDAKVKQRQQFSSEILSGEESEVNGDSGRKLSQLARPARKASKKALEEMTRETQRMSRNMQLAHVAQTKKKITKESFFARFNFVPEQENALGAAPDNSSSTVDSQNSSDAEAHKTKETPPTSPVLGPSKKPSGDKVNSTSKETPAELPTLEEMIAKAPQEQEQPIVAHVEDQAADKQPMVTEKRREKKVLTMPPIRVRLSREQVAQNQKDDSDSDLEIVTSPAKCRRYAAFENLPTKRLQESSAMLKLKALAQLNSPPRKGSMNYAELTAHLKLQARQQAAKERQERIEELRAKGIVVETAEERAAMEDQLENLLEKARKEAEEIAKQEKAASKGKQGEHYEEDDDDPEFSGSEEDNEEEEEDEDENGDDNEGAHGLFDSEASEDEESDDDRSEVTSSEETGLPTQRQKRPTRVISDDEDEDVVPRTPIKTSNPTTVHSVQRPHIPGLPSNDMTMSLTQAFAGTLGDNESGIQEEPIIPHSLPDPVDGRHEPDSQMIIKDSQEQRPETDLLAGYAQPEMRVSESPAQRGMSQFSQIPDPTQDAGFVLSPFDPSKRFLSTPTSTVETVLINQSVSRNNSPTVERKLKHLRRGRATELSIIEEQSEGSFDIEASAFDVMKKSAKKPGVPFDKNKSKARDVVEEAAEESDDEYAGLGGASDEDDDVEDAYDRQMINDDGGETVDEKQLAALNALHQRNADEKQVAKLLKDITTGALRRRRRDGDEFDLDDSDDELLARRRQKQREFARMRKALMADEKIGEIAQNPKKAAFFKAVEDRDIDDDGLDFLGPEENLEFQGEESSQDVIPDSQPDAATGTHNKKKRPFEPSPEDINNRPPPHMRRKPVSAMSKKPATLAEIRETVSFLTETPEYDSFHEDVSVDEDDEKDMDIDGEAADEQVSSSQSKEEFVPPRHPRRTRGPIVDRLALLRQASSNSATSASSNTRFAFQTGSGPDLIGFRPPMLRKTTTGSSTSTSSKSDSSRRVSKPATGVSVAKKGAVNYYTAAREKERERELRTRNRNGGSNITALVNKHTSNRLGALGKTGQWD